MEWTVYSTICAINLVICSLIYLPLAFIYYYKIIKPNSKVPVFKIRRPKFFFAFLIIFIVNGILRCSLALLTSINNHINQTIFVLIMHFSTYYGSITFGCIRVWLLFYDLRSARKQHTYMLSNYLTSSPITTIDTIQQETKFTFNKLIINPFNKSNNKNKTRPRTNPGSFISDSRNRQKHAYIFGRVKPLLCISYSIVTVLFSIGTILEFTHPPISRVT